MPLAGVVASKIKKERAAGLKSKEKTEDEITPEPTNVQVSLIFLLVSTTFSLNFSGQIQRNSFFQRTIPNYPIVYSTLLWSSITFTRLSNYCTWNWGEGVQKLSASSGWASTFDLRNCFCYNLLGVLCC